MYHPENLINLESMPRKPKDPGSLGGMDPRGGGGSWEKFSSQRVHQNLNQAILCGKYPGKLYPFHTIFIGFQITN